LGTDVSLLETMTRPVCTSYADAERHFGAVGFVTVRPESRLISTLQIEYPDATGVAAVGEVACADLYARAPVLDAACQAADPARIVQPNQTNLSFSLIVIAAGSTTASNVRLRLHR
jgi:hypothetical protein